MILAKFAEYDLNYSFAFYALLISLAAALFIVWTWFIKELVIKPSLFLTILFLIISSPISIFLFVYFYEEYSGRFFKL